MLTFLFFLIITIYTTVETKQNSFWIIAIMLGPKLRKGIVCAFSNRILMDMVTSINYNLGCKAELFSGGDYEFVWGQDLTRYFRMVYEQVHIFKLFLLSTFYATMVLNQNDFRMITNLIWP